MTDLLDLARLGAVDFHVVPVDVDLEANALHACDLQRDLADQRDLLLDDSFRSASTLSSARAMPSMADSSA